MFRINNKDQKDSKTECNNYILMIYFLVILILIICYIYVDKDRQLITGIVSILSGSAVALGLLNYIHGEETKKQQSEYTAKRDYIDFVGGTFDKIDSYYLENPNELNNLYYEFYGYHNFPIKDKKENINLKEKNDIEDKKKITDIEYIVLLKIIQQIEIMFITNEHIFEDISFKNKITNYTRSEKFKKVLAFNKNDFPSVFIQTLDKLQIIIHKDLQIEEISIPKLH